MTQPVPLVIDTDPGIDDAVALLVALGSPEVRVEAVTTVFGNVDLATTTANAARVLALAGRADVPVAAGADRPLVHPQAARAAAWHGTDGLGGQADRLPPPAAIDPRPAVTLIADVLRAAPAPVTIAAVGPLTNIALLLAVHPELADRIGRLVVMGGSLGGGNSTAAAEFNIWSDPEAARRVLVEERVPTTLVPLDLTMTSGWVGAGWLAALAASGHPGDVLASVLDHYRTRYRDRYDRDGMPLHDALAVLEAAVPGTLRTRSLPLEVACDHGPARGAVIADRRPGSTARCVDVALAADAAALHAELHARLGVGAADQGGRGTADPGQHHGERHVATEPQLRP